MVDKQLSRPTPDGRVDVLLFKGEPSLVSYYFSEIETWKTPKHSPHNALTFVFSDRKVFYPVENVKCWVLYPNSPGFNYEVSQWVQQQHELGHPEENPYQCRSCNDEQQFRAEHGGLNPEQFEAGLKKYQQHRKDRNDS